jgi:hypothetical protein
MVHLLEMH